MTEPLHHIIIIFFGIITERGNRLLVNPISHGVRGLKTAPPSEKLKYFFGHNRL